MFNSSRRLQILLLVPLATDSALEAERRRFPLFPAGWPPTACRGFPREKTGFPPTDNPRRLRYSYTVVFGCEYALKRMCKSMKRTIQKCRRAFRSRKGQSLVEYSLILALIAIVAITVLKGLGKHINNTLSSITRTCREVEKRHNCVPYQSP